MEQKVDTASTQATSADVRSITLQQLFMAHEQRMDRRFDQLHAGMREIRDIVTKRPCMVNSEGNTKDSCSVGDGT